MLAENLQTGITSELIVITEYIKQGYSVSRPMTMSERYDFVAEKGSRFVRVQVKTGTPLNGGNELQAYVSQPYTKNDADVVVIYDPWDGNLYYLPVEHIVNMRPIRLRKEPYIRNVKERLALDAWNYLTFLG